MVILGQLSITYRASDKPGYIDEEVAMPSADGSQVLRAVADPGEGSPLISIANLSESGQHVTIQCLTESHKVFSKSVDLTKGEALLTEACAERTVHGAVIEDFSSNDSDGPHGPVGISLTTDGMPGSFAAFGLVRHKKVTNQFFSNVTFTDPMVLHSSSTVFDGVPVGAATLLSSGSYTPELSLTNFSAEDQQVQIHYSQTSAGTPTTKDLASFKLAANTTRKMTFENLQGDPQLQNSFVVTSTGSPGDVLAKLVSRNDSANFHVELLGKDAQDTNNGGSNPWSIENGVESTLLFFNHDQAPQIFNVLIASADGAQWNKDFKLAPMETRAVSLGDIIQNAVKDDSGKTLPVNAVSGQISWWTVGTASGPGIGRVIQSNPASGMARSFACGCPYILCGTRFFDVITNLLLNNTGAPLKTLSPTICLFKTSCNGTVTSNSSSQALTYGWSSSNTSILQISGSSTNSSVNIYGANLGTANVRGTVSAHFLQPPQNCSFSGNGNGTVFNVQITKADIVNDVITVVMTPNTLNGTLTLTVNGPNISYSLFQGLEQGNTVNFSFNRPQLPLGAYTNTQASWNIAGSGTAVANSDVSFNVLGVYRHSQYNSPQESSCTGTPTPAWIINLSNCSFTQTTLKSDFISQVALNGSGVSQTYGNVQVTTQCSNYPSGANSGNSFAQVTTINGSCLQPVVAGQTVAVYPNPKPVNATWNCSDTVQLVTTSDANQAQKSVKDYCPACSSGFNGTSGHIDDYTSSPACSGHAVGDYGNFLTIRLRAQ